MNDERIKKYLPLFISIFMILTFLGLGLFGGYLFLIMMNDTTNFGLKVFGCITLFAGWSAWFWLGVLIERKFKIIIFRRGLAHYYDGFYRRMTRTNLLKVISRKHKNMTNKENFKS